MAAIAKGVSLSWGLINASVAVHNALEPKISNTSACGGVNGTPHELTKIQQKRYCETCATEVPYTEIKKAREVGGKLIELVADEIKAAKGDTDQYKKLATLTAHSTEEVETGTVPGEKLYYLDPEKGHGSAYDVLRHLVQTHPELTWVARWTPRSSVGTFALKLRGDVLVLQERVTAAATKAAPKVEADAPAALKAMAEQVLALPDMVTAFDPATYEDEYEVNIQKILASKAPGGDTLAPVVNLPTPVDAGDDLLANLAAMVAAAGKAA